jgi:hypothetical protein
VQGYQERREEILHELEELEFARQYGGIVRLLLRWVIKEYP